MKTIRTIFTVIIAALIVNVAAASGGLKVNFASNDAELTVVEISNAQLSNFDIKVADGYGEELYRMKTKAPRSEFKKRYDFTGLEDGKYWYTVKIDKEKITKEFSVEDGEVEVLNIRKSVEPIFNRQEDMIKLSFLNFQNEDVKLYVYDSKRKLLTESDLGSDMAIHKGIDISDLRYGDYKIVIANDWDVYEHKFAVN